MAVEYSGPFIRRPISPEILKIYPLCTKREEIRATLDETFSRCQEFIPLRRAVWVSVEDDYKVRQWDIPVCEAAAYNRRHSSAYRPDIELTLRGSHADYPVFEDLVAKILQSLPLMGSHEYGHLVWFAHNHVGREFWDEVLTEGFAMHFQEHLYPGKRMPSCDIGTGSWKELVKEALDMRTKPWLLEGSSSGAWSDPDVVKAALNRSAWVHGTGGFPDRALYGVAAHVMDSYRVRTGKSVADLLNITPRDLIEEAQLVVS